jgi:UDP-glucose 4-epimerase
MAKKQSVLITGGAGFIGSHLSERLLASGYKVIVFDNFQTGKFSNLANCTDNRDFFVVEGNINHRHHLRPLYRLPIDYIYHYAACVGVNRTLAQPLDVLDDIDGIRNILDLAREKKVKRFFYSSSSEVYGESVSFPQNENSTPLNSKLPYAAIKNLGEIYIRTYHKEYGIPYTIFRFFNTYGPRQSKEFVISKFISQALSNTPITVYGDGRQTRSFIYILDNIQATTNSLTCTESINKTINIGNPIEINMLDLAKIIIKTVNSKSKISHESELLEGDMPRRVPDIHLMSSALGSIPKTEFQAGLNKTIAFFKNEYQEEK